MQVAQVIQADPWKLEDDLNTLAATEEIQVITKTYSSGKFIVVSDNAAGTGQTAVVITGDPDTLATEIATLVTGGATIQIVTPTFSAAHYVVVYI